MAKLQMTEAAVYDIKNREESPKIKKRYSLYLPEELVTKLGWKKGDDISTLLSEDKTEIRLVKSY